jgi:hypothetical protein
MRIDAGKCGAVQGGQNHFSSQVHSTGLCHLSVLPGGFLRFRNGSVLTAGHDRRWRPMRAGRVLKRSMPELLCHLSKLTRPY